MCMSCCCPKAKIKSFLKYFLLFAGLFFRTITPFEKIFQKTLIFSLRWGFPNCTFLWILEHCVLCDMKWVIQIFLLQCALNWNHHIISSQVFDLNFKWGISKEERLSMSKSEYEMMMKAKNSKRKIKTSSIPLLFSFENNTVRRIIITN